MSERSFEVSKETLCACLRDRAPGITAYVYDCIDSTNSEAKRMAMQQGCDTPVLIAARAQSGGRGRMGRSFYSPSGTGAYFSILYRPTASVDAAVTVTCAASVAVLRAIRTLTGRTCGIKWVNDLYLDGKKVCGILTECQTDGASSFIIVGIGINVTTSFEETELSQIAGAIGKEPISVSELIAEVARELLPMLESPHAREWIADYRRHSLVIGRRVAFLQNGEAREGTALSIDDDGALSVRLDSGEVVHLFSGEISLKMQ